MSDNNVTDSGCITTTTADDTILGYHIKKMYDSCTAEGASSGSWDEYTTPQLRYQEPIVSTPYIYPTPNDMLIDDIYVGKPSRQEDVEKTIKWYKMATETNFNNKKGDDDMRRLYEVTLVNPKNDTFFIDQVITRSEISASMEIYHRSQFDGKIEFDDLKTSCSVLMEWKKEKSLKKAIETIKEAVE